MDAGRQKPYQRNRASKTPDKMLEDVRAYMAGHPSNLWSGKAWGEAEADDGLMQEAWRNCLRGRWNLHVTVSWDKDLRMCPGLHLDPETGLLEGAKPNDYFGFLTVNETTKKITGYGTIFFWLQMLMGDTCDNITGVPGIGALSAFKLIKGATNDIECLEIVWQQYQHAKNGGKLLVKATGEWLGCRETFWSEAKMLWLQRKAGDVGDVMQWIGEFGGLEVMKG